VKDMNCANCRWHFFNWRTPAYSGARVLALVLAATLTTAAQINVTTQHNDNARTGQNTSETILTPANVNSTQFGKLFVHPVLGQVYAQPLYVANVTIPGQGTHNVVYVATEQDNLYAFDADNNTGANANPLWQVSLIDTAHGAASGATWVSNTDVNCGDIQPNIGITSTPVIDPVAGTMFVEAKSKENGTFVHRLHAIDITTGAEKSSGPVVIDATVTGTGDGSAGGKLIFRDLAQTQHNRPGLLLLNGLVYIGFASHCDISPYHGWLFAYNASTLAQQAIFVTTANGGLGGIWMGGSGLAADASGNIFLATGNGTFDTSHIPANQFGDTILKIVASNLSLSDYFTPYNQGTLSGNDTDLGSGGVLLLPDQPGNFPHLLVQVGKQGSIYLVNRDQMTASNLHYCVSNCSNTDPQIVQELQGTVGGMWGMPAYWNENLYFWGQGDVLKAYSLTNGILSSTATSTSIMGQSGYAPTPSVSSNGSADGIVWAIFNNFPTAILRAYDATNLSNELYDSSQASNNRDKAGVYVKFSIPTVVNGKVYVGASTEVDVYGLLSGVTPTTATPTISPNGGTVSSSQPITLTDGTPGATIYFTTNGTVPSVTPSEHYTGAFTLPASATVQAIAVASGFANSLMSSANFIVAPPAATPTFNPSGGTVTNSQLISISDSISGASIYYTTNGSTPIVTLSEQYSGPFTLSASATVQAIAVATGFANSPVGNDTFTVSPSAAMPTFSPPGGTIASSQPITINGSSGASIYYTTDGTAPTVKASELYGGPFTLSVSATVQAIAVANGFSNSAIASTSYTIQGTPPPQVATPTLSPNGGTISSGQLISISNVTSGAAIYYTTDGSVPTATPAELYSGPFQLAASATVNAIGIETGFTNSVVATASYTVAPPAATPMLNPPGGTITPTQLIRITDASPSVPIYYTIDGSNPAPTPVEQYVGPFTIPASTTVSVIAVGNGFSTSTATSGIYTVQATPPPVNFISGFTSTTGLQLNGNATWNQSANRLRLTDTSVTSESSSAYYATPVNVQSFTNDFSFQLTNPAGDGFTFTIQNSSLTALGPYGGQLGYQGILKSVAVKFDLYSNAGEGPDSTGMYINGAAPTVPAVDMTSSGVNLHSGDVMNVHMTYDGTTLTWTITDATTGATFTTSAAVNIPSIVGGSTAWVGFTAGTGSDEAIQEIISWSYSSSVAATVPPTITTQPTNQTVNVGQTATFTVVASGTAPLTYQWSKNGTIISGVNAASYTTPATLATDNGATFRVVVSNTAGSAPSNAATLTVTGIPVITTQPTNQTVNVGQTATFTVVASGTAPFTYQWSKNGTIISGVNAASYTTPATLATDNGATFRVVVSNTAGSAPSNAATLTVNTPPVITTQPTNQTVNVGQTATFTVVASGTAPFTYQWSKNGTIISGVNAASYTTPATLATDSGAIFSVVVTNSFGSAPSNNATLTVNPTPPPPSINFISGFTSTTGLQLNGSAKWNQSASRLLLTDTGTGEAGSAFYTTPVNVQSFTTNFSFQLTNPIGNGITFTIQNLGATAIGPNGGGLGYGSSAPTGPAGIPMSVALKFDLLNNAGEGPNSTGLYQNGASPTVPAMDLTSSGVNLHSGDIMNVSATYDGTTLTMTITDATSGKIFTNSWAINIPMVVGSSTALVGFTGSTGGSTAIQEILSWTYTGGTPTANNPILYQTESLMSASVSSGPTYRILAWPQFSGGSGTILNATKAGDNVTITQNVPAAGIYDVRVAVKQSTSRGIMQLSVNGTNLGPTEDQYFSTDSWREYDLGTISLSAGNQTFKFTVTGKNASSPGYAISFDFIELTPQ
jgi:Cu/Ag efflux protein CusF